MTQGKARQQWSLADQPPPKYLWHSGRLVPWQEATVHISQVGWSAISAVFEGIRAYWNPRQEELYVFQLEPHLRRLLQSMKLMRMTAPFSQEELAEAITHLVRENGFREDLYIQPLAYFAGGIPGYLAVTEHPGEVVITARPVPSGLEEERAVHCGVSTWMRLADNVMPPRAKAITNYQNSRYVSTEAQLHGYDFGIILNQQGKVAEAAYACVFLVRDGRAVTPPSTAGTLESITRRVVATLLEQELGVPVQEREVDRTELYLADEVFLCGTAVEVLPVASVDHYRVGDGQVGPVTARLRQLFARVVRGEEERYRAWCTPVYRAL